MNRCRPLTATLLALLAAATAAPMAVQAQDSLADKRQAIIKGSAPGKVLLELPPVGAAASGAASSPARGGWFGRLPPPSGKPLNAARRLDAADQGIVIRPAAPAASAAPPPAR